MTRGAWVIVYGLFGSTVMTLQTGLPVRASSATNLPSKVPTKILPLPGGDAAIDHIAAAPYAERAGHSWIVGPKQRAGLGVIRLDHAPRSRDVQHTVDNERRRLLTAVGVEVGIPGETKLLHIVGCNPSQRTKSLFTVGPAISHPIGGIFVGLGKTGRVNISRRFCSFSDARSKTAKEGYGCPKHEIPKDCRLDDMIKIALARKSSERAVADPDSLACCLIVHRSIEPTLPKISVISGDTRIT